MSRDLVARQILFRDGLTGSVNRVSEEVVRSAKLSGVSITSASKLVCLELGPRMLRRLEDAA